MVFSLIALCGFPAAGQERSEADSTEEKPAREESKSDSKIKKAAESKPAKATNTSGQNKRSSKEQGKTGSDEKAGSTKNDSDALPVGISLAGPDGPVPVPQRERKLPPGAGVIGEGPRPGTARVRVIPEIPPPPEIPEVVVSPEPLFPERPAPKQEKSESSSPPRLGIGPSIAEQIDVFKQGILPAGKPVGGSSVWEPQSAWDEGDPANPYPWQPSKWAEPIIDPEWKPTEAFPIRDEHNPYPWNPSRWSKPSIDFDWYPTDSWGRAVEIPEVTTDDDRPSGGDETGDTDETAAPPPKSKKDSE